MSRLLGILLLSMLLATSASAQTVWINEIHYDNSGADVNEGVEIAGPAGTDLTGWELVAYNGSGGASYLTTPLGGTIPNQSNGFGTLWFLIAGLQNGSPDGIALVDGSFQVLQFLSYEGTFLAIDGPASGMMSIDIGVSESGTENGTSLQLVGTGGQYTDFVWASPSPQTMGSVNTGQAFPVVGVPGSEASAWRVQSVQPNPVTTEGSLTFEIPQCARIELSQYDVNGRRVGRFEQVFPAGRHSAPLHSSGFPAGIYLVRFDAFDEADVLRLRTTRMYALVRR